MDDINEENIVRDIENKYCLIPIDKNYKYLSIYKSALVLYKNKYIFAIMDNEFDKNKCKLITTNKNNIKIIFEDIFNEELKDFLFIIESKTDNKLKVTSSIFICNVPLDEIRIIDNRINKNIPL